MADIIERNATCARQLLECAAEIERLRAVLREIAAYYDGEFGVSNYQAKLAERALNEQPTKTADEPPPNFREMRGIFK